MALTAKITAVDQQAGTQLNVSVLYEDVALNFKRDYIFTFPSEGIEDNIDEEAIKVKMDLQGQEFKAILDAKPKASKLIGLKIDII